MKIGAVYAATEVIYVLQLYDGDVSSGKKASEILAAICGPSFV